MTTPSSRRLLALIEPRQHEFLDLRTPARLLVDGTLEEVLALEEEEPLANVPSTTRRSRAREDAMVKRLAGHEPAVIVLGGQHDLSDSLRRLVPEAEYVRMTTRRYHAARHDR